MLVCLQRMANVVVRKAMLVVSDVTVPVSVALFSMSCDSVVCLVVAAAVRLSKYLSKRTNVFMEIVASSNVETAFAVPTYAFFPAVSI